MDRRGFLKLIGMGIFAPEIPQSDTCFAVFDNYSLKRSADVVSNVTININVINVKFVQKALIKNKELIKEVIRKSMITYLNIDTGTAFKSIRDK